MARKPPAPPAPPERKNPALTLVSHQDSELLTQPSVRVTSLWTPAHLRQAQNMADGGDLWRLGDLCDQILGDERFGELLDKLAGSVLGCELSFEQDARSTRGGARYAKEIEEDWPTGWAEDELRQLIMWQELVGVGFAHHEHWIQADNGRIIPRLRAWHPKHFAFDHDLGQWKVRKRLPGAPTSQFGALTPIRKGDGEWVIMTRRGDFRPWANGLWRGLSRWWLLKQYAISDWGVHSEKGSKLLLLAPDGVSADDRRSLASDMFALAKDAVISLPAGFSMQLIETSANTRDIYQAQIDAADMAAAIAILGQNLTTRVDGGSYAAAQTHERAENRRMRNVSRSLGRTLFTQSLPWWTEYNFGDRKETPYPHFQTEPPADQNAKVGLLLQLGQALTHLHQAGFRLTAERIEEEYGVKLDELSPEDKATVKEGAAPGAKLPEPALPPGPAALPQAPAPRPRPRALPSPATRLAANDNDVLEPDVDAQMSADDDKPVPTPKGFVEGQQYIDRVSSKLHTKAQEELLDLTDKLIIAIDHAASPEEVAKAVLNVYANEQPPERLRQLCESAMTMAELAGRAAVNQER